ncbi:MAG: antibiotic biosynthesis monooxygenase [Candidatus Thermoplasmatota archaeon]|jgi:heme-degrading monooxygenase HmoA|nr:antibiotic biosynthesis monooxygenase [Candidatus Thermoplasmatota archaeon]MCL5438315.1 antibiotic biosynthesis monooxygenase [Candidatus Thermoplasmatota archaeon]
MIVVMNHIKVKKEYATAFEEGFKEREHLVDNFPGFISNMIMRPVKDESYIVMTQWESMGHFESWTSSEEFKKAHSRSSLPKEAFVDSYLTIHEVFSKT